MLPLLLLLTFFAAGLAQTGARAGTDISNVVSVKLGKKAKFNKKKKTYTLTAQLINTSSEPVAGPIRLTVTSISTPGVTAANASGTSPEGPYWVHEGGLPARGKSRKTKLIFNSASSTADPGFSITTSVESPGGQGGEVAFDVPTNSTDPEVMVARDGGTVVSYFGDRDEAGLPISIDEVRVEDAGGNSASIVMDDQGRPTQATLSDGTRFNIDWQSPTQITLEAVFEGSRVNVPIQLPAVQAPRYVSGAAPGRAGQPAAAAENGYAIIHVTRCGRPENSATVGLLRTNLSTNQAKTALATRNPAHGAGAYSVQLPVAGAPQANVQNSLSNLANQIVAICNGTAGLQGEAARNAIISAVENAASQSPLVLPAHVQLLINGARFLAPSLEMICGIVTNGMAGGQSILQRLQGNLGSTPDNSQQTTWRLQALARHPQAGAQIFRSNTFDWNGVGGPLQFSVDMGDAGVCGSFRTVLTWDTDDTDVDTHVVDSQGRHAYYGNKTAIPNGALDVDDTDGFGPETFSLSPPEAGTTYRVYVHYYSDHGRGPTTATMKVYIDDVLVHTGRQLLTDGQQFEVGTFNPSQGSSSFQVTEPYRPVPGELLENGERVFRHPVLPGLETSARPK